MTMTSSQQDQPRKSYVVEIYVHGLLYVRIERIPRWLAPMLAAAFPAIGAWLLTR
jgi:hypothetical protein